MRDGSQKSISTHTQKRWSFGVTLGQVFLNAKGGQVEGATRRGVMRTFLAFGVALTIGGPTLPNRSFAAETASVTIKIQIGPIALIDFPQGTDFLLYIPSREEGLADSGPYSPQQAPHVATAQIPFTVKGNAGAVVSVLPADVMRTQPDGPVGRAFPIDPSGPNQGVELPYRLRLEFPTGSAARPLAGLGNERGRKPTLEVSATANVASGPVHGIIYVIPEVIWGEIASGRFVNHGWYRGEVQTTIAATEN